MLLERKVEDRPTLRIDSAASSGSQDGWPALETGQSISTFCFLFTPCLLSVNLRKKWTQHHAL